MIKQEIARANETKGDEYIKERRNDEMGARIKQKRIIIIINLFKVGFLNLYS